MLARPAGNVLEGWIATQLMSPVDGATFVGRPRFPTSIGCRPAHCYADPRRTGFRQPHSAAPQSPLSFSDSVESEFGDSSRATPDVTPPRPAPHWWAKFLQARQQPRQIFWGKPLTLKSSRCKIHFDFCIRYSHIGISGAECPESGDAALPPMTRKRAWPDEKMTDLKSARHLFDSPLPQRGDVDSLGDTA